MEDKTTTLIDILNSPLGSFAFILGIMIGIGWIIFYVTKFTTKISAKHGEFAERVNKVETNIDDIRKDLAYVKGSIEAAIGLKDLLTRKKSPISLTELGEKISKENDFENIIAINWDKILRTLELENFKNAYDIQEFCIDTAFIEPEKFFK
jgi:hypothetical protein